MQAIVQPSQLLGTILAPASKSSMQRACAAALLHKGTTVLTNPGKSNDDLAALSVIKALGATVTTNKEKLQIDSSGVNAGATEVNTGESGLGLRMFAPIAALGSAEITLNGTGSLLSRPMDFFDELFPQLGITVSSNAGKLPIHIKGPLQPADITIDGSLSSQFLTGILFAFGSAATWPVTITVRNLKSKPYIDLTLEVMQHFGYEVVNNNYETFIIQPKKQVNETLQYTVEADWSGAAFLLVAGALAGKIEVAGLNAFSTQADKAILQALIATGAIISVEQDKVTIAPPLMGVAALKPFHFDATDCPDLFPPLVALAAYCDGTSVIEGVERLEHKESNRGLTLQEEFGKIGVKIKLQDNLMIIEGGTAINGAVTHSHHDHRIAMALAVAALKATGPISINDAEAINKSYPGFFEHLKMLGAGVSLT